MIQTETNYDLRNHNEASACFYILENFPNKRHIYIHQVSAGFCLFQQSGKTPLQRISLDGGEVTCNHSAFPLHSIARNRLLQKHHSDQENQRKIQLLGKRY